MKVYTVNEVADLMGVGRVTVYRWMNAGKLDYIYAGTHRRITQDALDTFIRTNTEEMKGREQKNATPGLESALAV